MEQKEVLNIASKYADSVRSTLTVRGIYLYGSSWARGTAGKDSDIDIAVVVDELPNDYLEPLTLLWKLTRGEEIDIEPILLKSDDDKRGFLATILKTGIPV